MATRALNQKISSSITSKLEIQFAIYEFAGYFTFGFLKEILWRCNFNYFAVMYVDYFISHPPCLVKIMSSHNYDALTAFFTHNFLFNDYSAVWIQVCCG